MFLFNAVDIEHTDILSLNRRLRRPEAQTDIFVPSPASLADLCGFGRFRAALVVEEDVWLLLEGALALHCQFGGHDCDGVQSMVR